jgi:hypothetical protein
VRRPRRWRASGRYSEQPATRLSIMDRQSVFWHWRRRRARVHPMFCFQYTAAFHRSLNLPVKNCKHADAAALPQLGPGNVSILRRACVVRAGRAHSSHDSPRRRRRHRRTKTANAPPCASASPASQRRHSECQGSPDPRRPRNASPCWAGRGRRPWRETAPPVLGRPNAHACAMSRRVTNGGKRWLLVKKNACSPSNCELQL